MVQRAIHLIDHSRYDLAEKELRAVLARDPQDYYAHAYLGFCQYHLDRHEEARQSAQQAIGLLPDHPFGHYVLGLVLKDLNQLKKAKESFEEAIRLEPENAQYHGMLGYVYIQAGQWQKALDCANKGLSMDPTNLACKNCRATALTHLGRNEEAHATIRDTLKDDPEDPTSFANLGWSCLHKGDHKKALEYFREALRLAPDYEWARNGMIQALKANYLVYKLLLMFYLWMSRLNPKARMMVVVGILVLFRVSRTIARESPELKPLFIPIIGLYLAFIYLTWTGTHFFNTLLRFNKFGRCVLNTRERRASNCYAGLVLAAIVSAIAGLATGQLPLLMLGGMLLLMTLPVCHLFDRSGDKPDTTALLFCIGLSVIGGLGIVLLALGYQQPASVVGGIFGLAFVAFTWTGFARSQRRSEI